jgi:hypothetical protein
MNSMNRISIASDFSPVPLGRFHADSPFNGTAFREKCLLPALAQHELTEIVFDGAEGYGSSFLEEAFGGLVRYDGFSKDDVLRRLILVSLEDPTLIDEVRQYIHEAELVILASKKPQVGPRG